MIFIGSFVVQIPKRNEGEHFTNLGMLTTLFANKRQVDLRSVGAKPTIEVIDGDSSNCGGPKTPTDEDSTTEVQKKEFEWNDNCVINLEEVST